ncbi:hypothetical protein PC129_g501 [Phytophthora cactorum]|uniref:ATP-dependent DNA helicase n=2 Tax=Phytophthora cactorum TaxID=29920 RepID=A0A8T1IWZ2_9STRA|nr:hypothetical protein PC128_g6106 [Phytophthora cactorum]KAG3228999.1 hypothetical protein PC129_g501 [Phytophthora cactorum]
MRVMSVQNESTATELAEFSEFLLQVGEGRHEINSALEPNCIKIPKDMLVENPVEELSEDREDEEIRPGAIPKGHTRMVDVMYPYINMNGLQLKLPHRPHRGRRSASPNQ